MNRFAGPAPEAQEFENIKTGTYDALLENAVIDELGVWEDGVDTGKKTTGIKLTFRLTDKPYAKRKVWKSLRFDNDKAFEGAAKNLAALGAWGAAQSGKDEAESIELAASEVFKLVENKTIVLYVGEFKGKNYCNVSKLRDGTDVNLDTITNDASDLGPEPSFDESSEIPF